MKAMRAHQAGGPEQLRYEGAPEPTLGDGQVRVRVRAAGINPADLVRLSGKLAPLRFPHIPGTDVCGEVEALSPGVTNVTPGDRVFGRAIGAGYAEKTCVLAREAIPLPDGLSFEEGAAIPIPFYTAYYALHYKAGLRTGETVLVTAGGGGVGVAAIQLAKVAGARVITTVGSQDKAERTRELGADVAINYKQQDFAAEVLKHTDGRGADVIIENVVSDNLAADCSAVARSGRIVLIGTGTGKAPDATFGVLPALIKDMTFYGMSLINADGAIPDMAVAISQLFEAGTLKAPVSKIYHLSEAAQALNDLLDAKVFGKLVLRP